MSPVPPVPRTVVKPSASKRYAVPAAGCITALCGLAVKVSAALEPNRLATVLDPAPVAVAITLLKPLATIVWALLLELASVVEVGNSVRMLPPVASVTLSEPLPPLVTVAERRFVAVTV